MAEADTVILVAEGNYEGNLNQDLYQLRNICQLLADLVMTSPNTIH